MAPLGTFCPASADPSPSARDDIGVLTQTPSRELPGELSRGSCSLGLNDFIGDAIGAVEPGDDLPRGRVIDTSPTATQQRFFLA
jgi:hypothetical protein